LVNLGKENIQSQHPVDGNFLALIWGRWGTPWTFGGGVPPASPNPDPNSDQKMPFSTPIFRPGLKNPYLFSDLTLIVRYGFR